LAFFFFLEFHNLILEIMQIKSIGNHMIMELWKNNS